MYKTSPEVRINYSCVISNSIEDKGTNMKSRKFRGSAGFQDLLISLLYAVGSRPVSLFSGGFRNLERGVQLLTHEAQLKILRLPRPLPVT